MLHTLRQAYPGISEEEILNHDMDWIGESMHRIAREKSSRRREYFMDTLTAVNMAWSGGENVASSIKGYLESLMTRDELEAMDAYEKAEMRAEGERRAAALMEMFKRSEAAKSQSIGSHEEQVKALGNWKQ